MQKLTKVQTAKSAIASVARTWAYVWILLTFIFMGFQAAAHGLANQLTGMNGEMLDLVSSVLQITLPLTVSVTFISIAFFREWFQGLGMFFFSFFVLVLCTILLAPNGLALVQGALNEPKGGNVITGTIFNLGKKYFDVYAWQYFLSSLVVGTFLGWIWAYKILPAVKRS